MFVSIDHTPSFVASCSSFTHCYNWPASPPNIIRLLSSLTVCVVEWFMPWWFQAGYITAPQRWQLWHSTDNIKSVLFDGICLNNLIMEFAVGIARNDDGTFLLLYPVVPFCIINGCKKITLFLSSTKCSQWAQKTRIDSTILLCCFIRVHVYKSLFHNVFNNSHHFFHFNAIVTSCQNTKL